MLTGFYGKSIPKGIFKIVDCQQAHSFLLFREVTHSAVGHANQMEMR